MFLRVIIISLIIQSQLLAAADLERAFAGRNKSANWYRSFIDQLISEKKYFTAVYWFKDYIGKGLPFSAELDTALAKVVEAIGVSQFEYLQSQFLQTSNSATMHYIYAKKLLKRNQYSEALNQLNKIGSRHMLTPYIYHMRAVIHAAMNNHTEAYRNFQDCVRSSEDSNPRMKLNKEYCMVGLARASYGAGQFEKAELQYLDIQKSSLVWPEILYEEAWTSYQRKNYNRTLGKLVTYKAPILEHLFGPKVEVLNAVSYLKLCLYEDARKIADGFWNRYQSDYQRMQKILNNKRRDYYYFYKIIVDFEGGASLSGSYENAIYKSILMDTRYQSLRSAFIMGTEELKALRSSQNSQLSQILAKRLEKTLNDQQLIIGSFVQKSLYDHLQALGSAFESMSYIKLEILSQKKKQLYSFEKNESGKRGDVKYLERNEKQYFWTFNGEFWADELGDYVFALKSECN